MSFDYFAMMTAIAHSSSFNWLFVVVIYKFMAAPFTPYDAEDCCPGA